MNEIIQKLQSTQDVITIITKLIIAGQYSEAQKYMPILTQNLGQGILMITISEFLTDDEKESERIYWIDQIQRVNMAMESGDGFRLIDVLYIETINKLNELMKEIKSKEGEI